MCVLSSVDIAGGIVPMLYKVKTREPLIESLCVDQRGSSGKYIPRGAQND